jgi:hypothetical protein
MGVWPVICGGAVGTLGVSNVGLASAYLNRLFVARVITGATKFRSPNPILSRGGSLNGFNDWHVDVHSTSALFPRATLVSQSAVAFCSLGMCLKCTGTPSARFSLKIP